jgi:CRISPR-associated endonuclease/helicase Cas3
VSEKAAEFANAFGWSAVARVAGQLHDIGKCSEQFQSYIKNEGGEGGRGCDHSTAGAREAVAAYLGHLGRMLAYIIAGHHAGLADAPDLDARLSADHMIPSYAGWQAQTGALPATATLTPTRLPCPHPDRRGFTNAFLVRMLFSCLVDADFLETERFHLEAAGELVGRGDHTDLAMLRDRLRAHMAKKRAGAEPSAVNVLRNAPTRRRARRASCRRPSAPSA